MNTVLFDLDGTLVDGKTGIVTCIRYAVTALGCSSFRDDGLEQYIGPPLYDTFAELLGTTDHKRIRKAIETYRHRFRTKGVYESTVYPGITYALKKICKAGYRTFVVTSKPAVFARRIIEHHDLTRFFDAVYGSELDGRLTDKAELIALAIRAEALSGDHRTVMVGDRGSDIKGALANGVSAIGVTYGFGTAQELLEAGAACLCESPRDLPQVLCGPK